VDWLFSFVPVVAIVLVAWFGKAFVETKAISLALKQETQELLHQQQANAKELEHMKTELQLAYATTSRRRTDVETKCLTFLDEVKFVYRQSSLSTAPLPPHGRAEEDILKQAELVYQTYHQIHATFFGLVPYISP